MQNDDSGTIKSVIRKAKSKTNRIRVIVLSSLFMVNSSLTNLVMNIKVMKVKLKADSITMKTVSDKSAA
jgi:hypothetical protein